MRIILKYAQKLIRENNEASLTILVLSNKRKINVYRVILSIHQCGTGGLK